MAEKFENLEVWKLSSYQDNLYKIWKWYSMIRNLEIGISKIKSWEQVSQSEIILLNDVKEVLIEILFTFCIIRSDRVERLEVCFILS